MILKVKNRNKEVVKLLDNVRDVYIEHEINIPDKLFFEVSKNDIKYFENEGYIESKEQHYVIKELEEISDAFNIVAIQDLEEFDAYYDNITFATVTLETMVSDLLPTGWKLEYYGNKEKKTVTANNMSAYDALMKIIKEFNAEIEFDNKNKIIRVGYEIGEDKGVYFTDELNLEKKYLSSESYDFATRIIPVGKDGLTIAAINNGKVYLEDFTYSDKVKTVYWEDNRYTVITNLKEAARQKLDKLCKPLIWYDTTVADLSKATGYEILEFKKGDIVTLIDRDTRVKDKYRIVEYKENIDSPFASEVVLGNKIKDLVTDEEELQEQINEHWSNTKVFFEVTEDNIKSAVQTAENYTDGAFKTYKSEREQTDRKIYESIEESTTYIDPETGQTEKVTDKILTIDKSVDGLNINISKKADKDKLVTQLNATSEYVRIKSSLITLDGNTDVRGDFNVSGNMVVGGTISASNLQTRDFESDRYGNTKVDGNSVAFNSNSSYLTIKDTGGRGQVDVNGTIAAMGGSYFYEINSGGIKFNRSESCGVRNGPGAELFDTGGASVRVYGSNIYLNGRRISFNTDGGIRWDW